MPWLPEGSNRCVKGVVKEAQSLRKVGWIQLKLLWAPAVQLPGDPVCLLGEQRTVHRAETFMTKLVELCPGDSQSFSKFHTKKSIQRREIWQVIDNLFTKIGLTKFYRRVISDSVFPFVGTIYRYCLHSHKHVVSPVLALFKRSACRSAFKKICPIPLSLCEWLFSMSPMI